MGEIILDMPFIKVWIHLVWATKNRVPLLKQGIRGKIFAHIRKNGKKKNIHKDFINGYVDHVHILISVSPAQTIACIVQLLKGESSYCVNKNNLSENKFEWQDEYFAVSVSETGVSQVREYITNQEEHHRKKKFRKNMVNS